MNRRCLLTWLAAVVFGMALSAAEVQVQATGTGESYRSAVGEALVSALEQYRGVTISSTERSQVVNSSTASSASENGQLSDQRKLALNEEINASVQKLASGQILGYVPLEDAYDTAAGKYRVRLSVRFAGPYVVGLDPSNRRRMAVATFRPVRANYSWRGQVGGTTDWAMALADKLNVCLTQTRKFTMLDRKYDAEVDAELARLSAGNAAPADAVRLNQKLGTDYLVVGEIAFSDVPPLEVNPYTGRVIPPPSNQMFAEITYRVLLAPTGQLKWTDVVRIDAASFAAGDLASFISQTTEAAACSISDGMMSNILPFEIVGRTKSGQLVVGEGGKSLKAGECLTVFALGEEVRDSRTGEVLDVLEDAVGTVQIVRVTEKLSYAQVVEGDGTKMVVGSRLRRVPLVAPARPAPNPPATSVKRTVSGGVVAPF
ncbi:MAG: hypothetical protein ACI4RA_06410 [Kiritimatiellia bacterium]